MEIRSDLLEAIVADRTSIIDNYIKTEDPGLGAITAFAGRVFYEPGWNFDVLRVVNGPHRFIIKSYKPEAK